MRFLLVIMTVISSIIYGLVFMPYYNRYFPFRKLHVLSIAVSVIINLIMFMALNTFTLLDLFIPINLAKTTAMARYLATVVVVFCQYKVIYKADFTFCLCASGQYTGYLYIALGIVSGCFSLVMKKGAFALLEDGTYYLIIMYISTILAMVLFVCIHKTIARTKKIKMLIRNKREFRNITFYQILFPLLVLLIHWGNSYEPNINWIATVQIIFTIGFSGLYLVLLNGAIKASRHLEYELHTRSLQIQFDRQLRHYHSYQKHTDSFRAFKHDYEKIMATVASLTCGDRGCKAGDILRTYHKQMQKTVDSYKNYSNNILIDAIMQDIANICKDEGIKFSAVIHVPQEVKLNDLDIIHIFTNVTDNALEACRRMEDTSERFIEITSERNDNWVIIKIVNSFNGELRMKNGVLQTIKPNKDFHGMGIKIVLEAIEELGGFIKIQPDQENKLFSLILLIPR